MIRSTPLRHAFLIVLIAALLPCLAWTGLDAQPLPLPEASPDPLPALLLDAALADYGSFDLSGLTPSQWQTFAALHVDLLDAEDARTRIQAMSNIIHVTNHYGDQVDFSDAQIKLYALYRFERDDTERIYALTALHALGDEAMMQRLARRYRAEKSSRVRTVLRAVLHDHFRNPSL